MLNIRLLKRSQVHVYYTCILRIETCILSMYIKEQQYVYYTCILRIETCILGMYIKEYVYYTCILYMFSIH